MRRTRIDVSLLDAEVVQLDELACACCSSRNAVMRFALKRLYEFYISELTVGKNSLS